MFLRLMQTNFSALYCEYVFHHVVHGEEADAEKRKADTERRALRCFGFVSPVIQQHAYGEVKRSEGCQQGEMHQAGIAHVARCSPQQVAQQIEERDGGVVHYYQFCFFMWQKYAFIGIYASCCGKKKKPVCSRTPTFIHVFIKGFWLLLGVFFKRVEGRLSENSSDTIILSSRAQSRDLKTRSCRFSEMARLRSP